MKFEHCPVDLGYQDLASETKPSGRKYCDPNGNFYPSITTVLSIMTRDHILEWKNRVGEEEAEKTAFQASSRGTILHDTVEQYIKNNPDYKKGLMPYNLYMFNSIKQILDKNIGKVFAQECALYSKHLGLAGRVDCVAEFDGEISIIDFKTSKYSKEKEKINNYFTQECAYAIMWEERTGTPITKLVTIMASDYDSPTVYIEHRDNWVKTLLNTIKQYKMENDANVI